MKMHDNISSYSVSSVLNKETKQFGKQFIFDGKDETCWNSDQGSPQWILVVLKDKTLITSFSIQFQGGFAGKDCIFKGKLTNDEELEMKFYPEDNNSEQTFGLKNPVELKSFQIYFSSSTDFFGRIVVYRLSWK